MSVIIDVSFFILLRHIKLSFGVLKLLRTDDFFFLKKDLRLIFVMKKTELCRGVFCKCFYWSINLLTFPCLHTCLLHFLWYYILDCLACLVKNKQMYCYWNSTQCSLQTSYLLSVPIYRTTTSGKRLLQSKKNGKQTYFSSTKLFNYHLIHLKQESDLGRFGTKLNVLLVKREFYNVQEYFDQKLCYLYSFI